MSILVAVITIVVFAYLCLCIITSLPWLRKKHGACFAQAEQKHMITIDDMPDEAADEILDVLHEHSLKAVIFVVGSRIEKDTALLKRIIADGHTLGNHSYMHYFFNPLSTAVITNGFTMNDDVLNRSGLSTPHIRTPHGYQTPGLMRWCRENGKTFWYWDIMLWDFLPVPFSVLRRQADRFIKQGGILCMHGRRRSVKVLRYIAERIVTA